MWQLIIYSNFYHHHAYESTSITGWAVHHQNKVKCSPATQDKVYTSNTGRSFHQQHQVKFLWGVHQQHKVKCSPATQDCTPAIPGEVFTNSTRCCVHWQHSVRCTPTAQGEVFTGNTAWGVYQQHKVKCLPAIRRKLLTSSSIEWVCTGSTG